MRNILSKIKSPTFKGLALPCLFALAMAGCGGGGGGTTTPPPTATTLNAVLSGAQEVPATASAATGTATVQIDAARTTITVNLQAQGFASTVTAAHIHFGKAGVNGGVMFPLFAAGPTTTFTSPLTKTLTSLDFTATAGAATFAEAVTAILNGNAYINVHTQANPNGDIRGQIGPVSLAATLGGTQEVPATVSAATGAATIILDNTQSTITVNLTTQGFASTVTAAHIHFGKAGANGGIMFPLFAAGPTTTFTSPLTKSLTSADFTAVPGGPATFAEAVNAILSGNAYINVHTNANPNGDIRGQIGPARFTVSLSGANEVPPSGSLATGTATVQFDATQSTINVNMEAQGFTSTVTASHIHFGAAGVNGGIMFPLFAAGPTSTFTSPLTKSLTSADFTAVPGGPATFAESVNAILSGNAYINIHTVTNPNGDIRGQLTPQ